MLDFDPPARQVASLLDGVTDDALAAPTPCAESTVGDLLDHLLSLSVEFTSAATKSASPATGGPPPKASTAHLPRDWRTQLPQRLRELAAAWKDPAAWEGMTVAGGVTMPGELMGTVAVNELVIHGWDLARATGQPFDCDPDSAQASLAFTSYVAQDEDLSAREGLFGPAVEVPQDAPVLHRALGFSGRDPAWTP